MSAQSPQPSGHIPAGKGAGVGQPPFLDVGAMARQLANQTLYASRAASAAIGAQMAPVADPNVKLAAYHHGFQDTMRTCLAVVVDTTSIANAYRVQVEKIKSPIIATALTGTGNSIFGATEIGTYAPGTTVVVIMHPKMAYGFILGSIPDTNERGYDALHDYVTQVTRKRVDDAQRKYIKLPAASNVPDFSNWRPWDTTDANEWGAISATGLKVTLDDFMVQLAVNEFCGVFGFYHDMLLRVAGYNMQTWTAGYERDNYMDQAECNDYQGYTPYPWEQMGVFFPKDIVEEYFPKNYQYPNMQPFYAHWENKKDCQQPFHRAQLFQGYLGQGGRTIVQAPPQSPPDFWSYAPGPTNGPDSVYDAPIQTKDGFGSDAAMGPTKTEDYQERPPIQLHEDNVAMDGRRFIATAKGFTVAKRIALPPAVRKKRFDAPDGDDAAVNYKAGSKFGGGPEHPITGDVETTADQEHMQRVTGVLDLHAYLFNYVGLHPFHWHDRDYKTWEQSQLEPVRANQKVPTFSTLKTEQFLPHPVPLTLPIDHRYDRKEQKFYETESLIDMLEDGSIVIGDGYGAEIRLCAGSIYLSAPGDVWLKPGRSAQIWAGRDIVQKAVKNIDISSTERNIRIKAERNVMILAGNDSSDKQGGVLIESRATAPVYDFEQCGDDIIFGGVVLRAPKSEVVTLAKNIYLRSGGGESEIEPGVIMLDCGKGESELITKSRNVYQFVGNGGAIYQFFRNQADDDTESSNYFSKDYTLLIGPLGCSGTMIVDGIDNGASFIARGHIISAEGHIITEEAANGNIFVAPCAGECQSKVNKAVEEVRSYIEDKLPKTADLIDDTMLEQLWYKEKRPGNADVMDTMEFSFRDTKQYSAEKFEMWEDRWQQLSRFCSSVDTWTERPVKSKKCSETWPFPGKEKFEEPVFFIQDLSMVQTGCDIKDKDRNSNQQGNLAGEYRDPKFVAPQKLPLTSYPIVGGGT